MSTDKVTHVGFSDESHWNTGRFRSLGLITTPLDVAFELEEKLRDILKESGISEFEWKKLDGAKERFAAIEMCDFAVNAACEGILRVDVLIWDILDRRHNIRGRDDIANLQRMYYHLFRNVLRARWPNNSVWRLHPDENTAMDWKTVKDCLDSVSITTEVECSLFTRGKFRHRLRREFGVEEIRPVTSTDNPLLQLADLFAGLAVFSREKFDEYQRWLETTSPQQPLFTHPQISKCLSRSSVERFQVLKKFDDICKKRKLGVSLKTERGLKTFHPSNPINFWMYEPTHPLDKAPVRYKNNECKDD